VASICALVVLAVGVGAALAGSGGNKTGQPCLQGKYANYVDPATNRPFATVGACTAFVARGNTLVPVTIPTPVPTLSVTPTATPGPTP
jgi:hypothetical protein